MTTNIKALFSSLAAAVLVVASLSPLARTQDTKGKTKQTTDAVQNAQTSNAPTGARPEQQKTDHDRANIFGSGKAQPASPAFKGQPAAPVSLDPAELQRRESANRPNVMNRQKQLLERRFNLQPKFDPQAKMSRGKPLPVGPTARLAPGMTWERLAQMSPEEIRQQNAFPYLTLPHPLQANGGQVFPDMQLDMFPRLKRFDVDFDLPEAFIPEFPPALFLSNRPELGDVSRGEVVSINNYYRLFKDLVTPVQLDGLRLLLTPLRLSRQRTHHRPIPPQSRHSPARAPLSH